MTNATALEVRVVGAALVSKVDVAEIAPRVAEGIPPALPFIASAVSDSAANPTDGGLYRKTEYTFFCLVPLITKSESARQENAPRTCRL